MRKLRLDVDELAVESFATLAGEHGHGTVRGGEKPADAPTIRLSCNPWDTCDTSCAGGPYCDCLPSGYESCQTSCAGGPFCDCMPTLAGSCATSCAGGPHCDCVPNTPVCADR